MNIDPTTSLRPAVTAIVAATATITDEQRARLAELRAENGPGMFSPHNDASQECQNACRGELHREYVAAIVEIFAHDPDCDLDAAYEAAQAEIVRDLVSADAYRTLAGPWNRVMGQPGQEADA